MFKPEVRFFLPAIFLLLFFTLHSSQAAAQDDTPLEIGGSETWEEEDPQSFVELGDLQPLLDLGAGYTRFTGQDMNKTYDGIPRISVGANFRISRFWWLYSAIGFGQTTGDPFHGTPGIAAVDYTEIRYAPFNLGLKYNLARSTRVRVYIGLGFEFAWMEETIPLLSENGEVTDISSTGLNKGFTWSFGPEFVVGGAGQALGVEIGGGGSKGAVSSENHSHDVDMTGYRGRAYFVFPL
jgi:hypothetical protein